MAAEIKMVLCPSCRTAVPDKIYYGHSKECQAKKKAERGK
jgi:hypothetical protein